MREVDLCVKGWNWGEATVNGSLLSFLIDSKRAFEIPLKEVSQVHTLVDSGIKLYSTVTLLNKRHLLRRRN